VALCGPNRTGAFGAAAARHLASAGVRTFVLAPDLPHLPEILEQELKLFKKGGGQFTTKAKGEANVCNPP